MVLKFAKFYKGADDKAYAISDDGLVFCLSVGVGFGFQHVEKLPDGAKEVTAQEWAAANLPESIEFHVVGKEEAEHELTAEEKAMDAAWRNGVRGWRQDRAEAVARAVRDAVGGGLDAFEITETVTKSYNSPALLAAVAAVIGAGQPPEDPIEWRRNGDKINRMAELMETLINAAGQIVAAITQGKVSASAKRTAAQPMPPAQPQPQSAPRPAPATPPAEPKAEAPTKP